MGFLSRKAVVAAFALAFALATSMASAVPILSAGPTLVGAAIDFEGRAEAEFIDTQYPGVTFGQVDGGRPMIDNSPFLFGYTSVSGEGVLTGSTEGGAPFPTVAALQLTFDTLANAAEFYLSDTAPLGNYTVSAFGTGGVFLESFVIPLGAPIGSYVGFSRPGDLWRITVDSDVVNDAFAIDDVRFDQVPEPGTLLLFGAGLGLLARRRRRG
jgi:hypothetical protein